MTHQVVQVLPRENYNVFVYFADGTVKEFDVTHLIGKGVFAALADRDWYMERCTVLNGTLAWDRSGRFDPRECIDIDPEVIYETGTTVADPLQSST